MQTFYAVIIGAGPGGLSCARLLASHGHDVLVLERSDIVGPKVCGGGITWSGLIRRVPEELTDGSFAEQYIHSSRQSIRIASDIPIIATISREKLGQWMSGRAVEAGAVVKTGARVREINSRYVSTAHESFAYRYLVGADGSASLVRKYLRIPTERLGTGIHYQVPGRFEKMEWHLDADLFDNGYAWIFPYKGWASVGIYGNDRKIRPKLLLEKLHAWAIKRGIELSDLRPRAGSINFDYRGWRFGNKMLVGDAAGLASGLTGEGMYPAIVSGETAAQTIIDPDFSPAALDGLIRKQQKHRQVLRISGINKTVCRVTMEMLVLALRMKLIRFSLLEMAD